MPLLLPLPPFLGLGQEGEGPLEDTVIPTKVGTEAATTAEDALLLRA
jgi:hypothetical protein